MSVKVNSSSGVWQSVYSEAPVQVTLRSMHMHTLTFTGRQALRCL